MKITLKYLVVFAPVALCLAQTPPKPATTPAHAPVQSAKPAPTLEDVPGTDPVVISVGDEKMTKSQYERLISSLSPQIRSQAQGPGKRQVAEQVAQLMSMAQEARKRGIDKTPETRQLVAFQTDTVLASALFREIQNAVKPDQAAIAEYYEKHKGEYESVTSRHILIRFKGSPVPLREGQKDLTEEEALAKAKEIRAKLAAGGDFAKLAEAESDDVQSGKNGGSLGTFARGRMVPQFEEAAFKQPVGEISEPIKTQFGYHIIQVEKRTTSPIEEAKAGIEQRLKPEMAQKAVEDIKKQSGVTISESYFGNSNPAPAPAARK